MTTATLSQTDFELKSSLTGNYSVDEADGIVECFVAAIGNKDQVGDIILPGAFEKTLKSRKPRVVWGHDWNHPIGKVLEVYEVGPGDPRLPLKMRSARVGGLFAKVQFNLKSEKGREAFHNIVFYGADQEWSIGYKTRESEFDGHLQANMLKELDLFEMSPVLHGANSLTATISIKSANGESDPDPDDDVIVRGLAMLKTHAENHPDWVEEVEGALEEKDVEEKVGPGNIDAVQDAVQGDILHGRGPRRGNMEDLLNYWRPIMKKPGGFRRCLIILADHPELGPLPNLCAWLHHETTGKWPNEGKNRGGSATRHVIPGKSAEGDEVNSNPIIGHYASLAKALGQQFGGAVAIRTATPNSVVYSREIEGEDLAVYSVKYHSAEGDFLFGYPQKLDEPKKECGCGGSCCSTSKSLEEDLVDLEEKVGRVLSGTNSEKITQALLLLREVLSSGGLDVETKTPDMSVKTGDPGLATALMVVGKFYGDETTFIDGDIMNIHVKSIEHRTAVENVLLAMNAELSTEGEVS